MLNRDTPKGIDTDFQIWYNIGVQIKKVHPDTLYAILLGGRGHTMPIYRELLKEHELNCLAKWLKNKFNDTRSVFQLKELIREECQ